MGRDFHRGGVQTCGDKKAADHVAALQAEIEVVGRCAGGVGVTDDRDFRNRPVLHGLQHVRNERAALVGQLVGLEAEWTT